MVNRQYRKIIILTFFLMAFLLTGCSSSQEPCPKQQQADLSGALAFAQDEQFAFQFPLDELGNEVTNPPAAVFCTSGRKKSGTKYHAAEDYHLPPGSPVFAVADGEISFSGPMGGYGWLIIIDHPQANIYSLYGHLSPSRWRLESGPVEKGDLIAYLGNSDENGGTADNPLRPHLHFAIRAGQRKDYPGQGEWRWQAGWIRPCPKDVGWLNPSKFITEQEIPSGGFLLPEGNFLSRWGVELVLISIYLIGAGCMIIYAIKKDKVLMPAIYGCFMIVAGWIFSNKGTRLGYILFPLAALMIGFSIFLFVRKRNISKDDGLGE